VIRIEPRWPVILAIAITGALLESLPDRVKAFPWWVPYLVAIVLIVPMAALAFTTAKTRWMRIENIVTQLFFAIAGFGMVDQLIRLLSSMVRRSGQLTGLQLLTSSIAVWAGNVLLFSIAYWRTDRGGPEARANGIKSRPDWLYFLSRVYPMTHRRSGGQRTLIICFFLFVRRPRSAPPKLSR
jgi:hypothetical protein